MEYIAYIPFLTPYMRESQPACFIQATFLTTVQPSPHNRTTALQKCKTNYLQTYAYVLYARQSFSEEGCTYVNRWAGLKLSCIQGRELLYSFCTTGSISPITRPDSQWRGL